MSKTFEQFAEEVAAANNAAATPGVDLKPAGNRGFLLPQKKWDPDEMYKQNQGTQHLMRRRRKP